jgi:thioredoxin reductase
VSTYRIAIVGAGPAGYFAAQALQNSQTDDLKFEIDMIERLPTPWGLVRSGVAPDHPKIKTVAKVFEKIATTEGFRLFANVELGKDVTIDELEEMYDAVVVATGTSKGKNLGIPGEDLPGSLSAADFVPWYNAHPDYVDVDISLDCDTAVVIGAGNVAMDVARMLALEPKEFDTTDTAEHALEKLHDSSIRKVHICGRRGPEHAAFTSPELRELPKLEHTNVHIDQHQISEAIKRAEAESELPKDLKSNLDAMQTIAEAERFGIKAKRTRDGVFDGEACVWVTNYEQLHKYDPMKFGGFVGDESSGIKDFKSERKATVVEFMRTIQFRLLCTATAAPNDFWELGTSSEALGLLGFRDMVTKFFKQETSKDHHGWGRTKYRFRGHAEEPFWSWVCSWARSIQKPSDLGFDDTRFVLPPLTDLQKYPVKSFVLS